MGLLTNTQPLAHGDTAYRVLLADEAEHARQRLHDIDARLAALGQSSLVSTTMSAVRDLGDDTLEVSMAAPADTGAAGEQPLPIPDYDHLTANRVVEQLPRLSPDELDIIEAYELAHANRVTVLNKIHALTDGGTKP